MGNAAAVRPEGADFCSPFQKSSRSHLGHPRLSGLFPPLVTALPEEMGPVGPLAGHRAQHCSGD